MKKIVQCLVAFVLAIQVLSAAAYELKDFDHFMATNECEKCDLSWAPLADKDFSKARLDGAILRCADLQNTILRMADLAKADLSCANLSFTNFEAADLFEANFTGAKLEGTIFDGAYLAGAILDDNPETVIDIAQEEDVEVKPVIVESAHPEASEVVATSAAVKAKSDDPAFEKSNIAPESVTEITTEVAPLPVVQVETPAQLKTEVVDENSQNPVPEGVIVRTQEDMLEELEETNVCIECDFSGMDLSGMKFKWAFLERSNFEGAILNGTRFKGANLKSVSFRNADLRDADLRKVDLYKADLEGADLAGANFRKASIDGAYMGGANLVDVNWEKVRR